MSSQERRKRAGEESERAKLFPSGFFNAAQGRIAELARGSLGIKGGIMLRITHVTSDSFIICHN
jgi:hypothetical protein